MTTKPIPYAAFFMSFPVIITGTGRYVTRCGDVVEIDDASDYHWKRGTYPCGIRDTWNRSGRIFSGIETDNDIIKPA